MKIKDAHPEITKKCKKLIQCDTARISHPNSESKMFFIIGYNRNTVNDEGQWIKNGEPIDFDYVQEQVIASGYTEEELIESVKEYTKIIDMKIEDYLKEYHGIDIKSSEYTPKQIKDFKKK